MNTEYFAFISYRHADNLESGRQWATWLHQAIETYEVPQELVGKVNERGDEIPARIFPVFRDEEALPADSDLSNVITKALDNTRFLIVLCSPNARQSSFVADEIRYFKQLGKSDRIVAAIIDGEPNTSLDEGKRDQGFCKDDECFPEPLQFAYDEHGKETGERAEPVAADFRFTLGKAKQQGWTTPQALKQHLAEHSDVTKSAAKTLVADYEKQLNLMLLKIIAGIIGVPLDELTARDKAYQLELERQRSRRLKQWLGAVVTLAAVAVLAGVVAFNQKMIADEKTELALLKSNESLASQSQFLMTEANARIGTSENEVALLLGLNAMPGKYGGDRPTPSNVAPLYRAAIEAAQKRNSKKAEFVHQENVNQSTFSPDGRFLITSSSDYDLFVWSADTGEKIHEMQSYRSLGYFSPDSQYMVVPSSGGKEVDIYETTNWTHLHSVEIYAYGRSTFIRDLAFSPDSQTLAVASKSYSTGMVSHWSLGDGQLLFKKELEGYGDVADFVRFSADSAELFVFFDNRFEAWALDDQSIRYTVEVPEDIKAADISPDGQRVAVVTNGPIVKIWSTDSGEPLASSQRTNENDRYAASSIRFSPDGQSLVTLQGGDIAWIWSADSAELQMTMPHGAAIHHAEFNQDATRLTTAGDDNTARIWTVENGELLQTVNHKDKVFHSMFHPNSETFATASRDGTGALWRITDPNANRYVHDNGLEHLVLSHDGRKRLVFDEQGNAHLRDTENGSVLAVIRSENGFSNGRFCPDGERLILTEHDGRSALVHTQTPDELQFIQQERVSAYSDDCRYYSKVNDTVVELWELASGNQLAAFEHEFRVMSTVFSPDSKTLLVETLDWESRIVREVGVYNMHSDIVLWSVESKAQINEFAVVEGSAEDIMGITFSRDGQQIFIRKFVGDHQDHYGELTAYTVDGQKLHDFVVDRQKSRIRDEAVSPNGKLVAIARSYVDDEGRRRGDLSLWSVESGAMFKHLKMESDVSAVFFSHDQKLLVSKTDEQAQIWLTAHGIKLHTIDLATYDTQLAFSPFDYAIVERSENYIASHPIIQLEDLVDIAERNLPENRRCLTPEERQAFYLPSLSNEQWIKRGCPQFTEEGLASLAQKMAEEKAQQALIESLINWSKMNDD